MPELIQTLKSYNKQLSDERKFLAGLKGIDLESSEDKPDTSFEDVRLRSLGIEASYSDVVSLQGPMAQEAGFGINAGLGYEKE
jgi:hypothetical protein